MSANAWIYACGAHSLGFALFHLGFWRLLDWPASLRSTTLANRAVIQILNLRLVYVLLGVAAACVLLPDALRATPLGRALLGFMALFWVGRLVEQWVFLRVDRPLVHALTALFVLGAFLFGWALFAAQQG